MPGGSRSRTSLLLLSLAAALTFSNRVGPTHTAGDAATKFFLLTVFLITVVLWAVDSGGLPSETQWAHPVVRPLGHGDGNDRVKQRA